jgi:uncharacterized protein with HEPN domain
MSYRPIQLLIEDIWESIEKIERYISGLDQDAFLNDEKTVDSVVRNLEIIGEAANRLPGDFKTRHSEIAWHRIVGLRNRIVHNYFGIDLDIVWEILQRELPDLKEKISTLRPASKEHGE